MGRWYKMDPRRALKVSRKFATCQCINNGSSAALINRSRQIVDDKTGRVGKVKRKRGKALMFTNDEEFMSSPFRSWRRSIVWH
jgi:hypothetical protein